MRRLIRLLLRLYSKPFRADFGDQAVTLLKQDMKDARGGGVSAPLRRIKLLLDFAVHGILDRVQRTWTETVGSDATIMDGWVQDARLALRSTLRRPGFVLIAVTSLVFGVGANAVVFSVVDSLMLRDIPGATEPDRIVDLDIRRANGNRRGWDFPTFMDVRNRSDLLEHFALSSSGTVNLASDGPGQVLPVKYVTSGYFESMGVVPIRGRTFGSDEDLGPGEHAVAVLGHAAWIRTFNAAPNILGREIRLNRESYVVVGVVPEDFKGHDFGVEPHFYLPITQHPSARQAPDRYFESRGTEWAQVIGRLSQGVDRKALNAELESIFRSIGEENPDTNLGVSATAGRAGPMPSTARVPMGLGFLMIGTLMFLVLAASCANVGGMLLARAASQEKEMALRMALGAGRARVVRLLFFESLLIFTLGGIGGIWLAVQSIAAFDVNMLAPTPYPVDLDFALDWRIMAFGLALTMGTGVLFGLIPAMSVTRDDVVGTLRDHVAGDGLRASRLRRVFVGGQVAVSMLLLATSALFFRSMQEQVKIEPAIDPTGIYVTRIDLSPEGYPDASSAAPFLDQLIERLAGWPGLENVAVASSVPLDARSSTTSVRPTGTGSGDDAWIQTDFMNVTAGIFETMGIDLLSGRSFNSSDGRLTPRVAVVNQLLAERAWPDEDAVGQVVEFGIDPVAYTIIGVVGNTQSDLATDDFTPQIYSLLSQDYTSSVAIVARQTNAPDDFVAQLRREILAVDPALALGATMELAFLAELGTLPYRLTASITSILGGLALFLSGIGVYGIVAFMVTQQTRDIGVRIALGASRLQVRGRVVRGGLLLTLPGFAVGIVLAGALARVVGAVIPGIRALDPFAYGAVAVILLVTVALASFVPARRASLVQPMNALRQD